MPAKPDTSVSLLKKAKALLERKAWTQFEAARFEDGLPVYGRPHPVRHASFCALGAVTAVVGARSAERLSLEAEGAHKLLFACVGGVIAYNDTKGRTKAQILRLYDRAIALGLHREKDANP